MAFVYDYQDIAFKRPQSVHKWRQSDCASIALNYYQDGMNFFKPETHNLTSDNGTSGKCFTSEIPILYYSVAVLYKVFGYHDYVYRIFNTLIFFLGLFYLFRFFQYLLKDVSWAIILSLLFFTSPLLVYYGNNFLSNSSALAFSIIGWYYFIRFLFEKAGKWFFISLALFFLAAAFKITALFSLFAISGILILEFTGLVKFREDGKVFSRPKRIIFPLISVFVVLASWLVYAHLYNQAHDCSYFSTTVFPAWEMSAKQILKVVDNVKRIWLSQYFHISVLLFIAACFFFCLVYFKKCNKVLIYSVLIILSESIVYILLQFMTFADHDYYVIDMYILPILIAGTAFDLLKRHFYKIFSSPWLKGFLVGFLVFNIYYANRQINLRYKGWMNDYEQNEDIYSITPYLRELGISPGDTIISIPDYSHASLYLMNQKGWTEYTDAKFNRAEKTYYNQDSAGIQLSINKGARYLIVNGMEVLYTKPYLQSYCTHLAGKYKNVMIFDLISDSLNFSVDKRIISGNYFCSAEELVHDGGFFTSEKDSALFQAGQGQSDDYARSGMYSCKVFSESPYGMTIKLQKLKAGESFYISTWRKATGKSRGELIASSSPNPFYENNFDVVEKDSDGWEKIVKEFFVPEGIEGQELVIYVFCNDTEPVYFDDLEIIRYKPGY